MRKIRFLSLFAAFAVVCGLVGCQADDTDISSVSDISDLTILNSKNQIEKTVAEVEELQAEPVVSTLPVDITKADATKTEICVTETFESFEAVNTQVELVLIAGNMYPIDTTDLFIDLAGIDQDISEIRRLSQLKSLTIVCRGERGATVNGFSNISYNKNLEEVYIDLAYIYEDEFESLGYCNKLKKLHIELTSLSDITWISNLENLNEVYFCNVNISDISPLFNLVNLKKLDVIETNITEIKGLENLINLDYLYISCNNISSDDLDYLKSKLTECKIE